MKRLAILLVLGMLCGQVLATDFNFDSAGPISIGYVGMYYGLTDLSGNWYTASDLFGDPSTSDLAVVDTGASASILGKTAQDAYAIGQSPGIPLQPYPAVHFGDVGFGGTADFAVTQPLRLMLGGQKSVGDDTENHSLYFPYAPIGGTSTTLAAATDFIGGGELDVDIIGASILQGRVLHVDPHDLQFLRWTYLTMAGTLEDPAPAPNRYNLYVPVTMHNFFSEPQSADVGSNPMLPVSIRMQSGGAFVTHDALLDSGSPVSFISESYAQQIGIDLGSTPDLTISVSGVGSGSTDRPGWYVDSIGLAMGNGRQGEFLIHNSAVFVIPDADMPGGLAAILGNAPFSSSSDFTETTLQEWYLDTRDPNNSYLILVAPRLAADANKDGTVNFADYQVLEAHFGLTDQTVDTGDFNGDGLVSFADYQVLEAGFGQSIPEPGTLSLLALGGLALIRRRRQR